MPLFPTNDLYKTLMAFVRPLSPGFSPGRPARTDNSVVQFYRTHWSAILLVVELFLNLYFLHHGPLHPIDYPTYLIQARQIRRGERDYARIYGPTGPLVYPGGHVVIFRLLEKAFGIKGDDDWQGYLPVQWIFLCLQLLHTWVRRRRTRVIVGSASNLPDRVTVATIRLCVLSIYYSRAKCLPKRSFQRPVPDLIFVPRSVVFVAKTDYCGTDVLLARRVGQDERTVVGAGCRRLFIPEYWCERHDFGFLGRDIGTNSCGDSVSKSCFELHTSKF
jgi:ALG3 protein